MLFNSYIFILCFLPVTWCIYFALNKLKWYRCAQYELIIASLFFYGYYNWKYLLVISVSILINYTISVFIRGGAKGDTGKPMVIVGILFNLGILFYFKYINFFIENVNSLIHTEFVIKEVFLPLGISFYTFQQISFIVDTYAAIILQSWTFEE